jgi:hypothetical protein
LQAGETHAHKYAGALDNISGRRIMKHFREGLQPVFSLGSKGMGYRVISCQIAARGGPLPGSHSSGALVASSGTPGSSAVPLLDSAHGDGQWFGGGEVRF